MISHHRCIDEPTATTQSEPMSDRDVLNQLLLDVQKLNATLGNTGSLEKLDDSLDAAFDELGDSTKELGNSLKKLDNTLDAAFDELSDSIEELDSSIDELVSSIEELNVAFVPFDGLGDRIDRFKNRLVWVSACTALFVVLYPEVSWRLRKGTEINDAVVKFSREMANGVQKGVHNLFDALRVARDEVAKASTPRVNTRLSLNLLKKTKWPLAGLVLGLALCEELSSRRIASPGRSE
jgi:hypothetical protein